MSPWKCRVCLRAEAKLQKKSRSLFDKHKGCLIWEKLCLFADIKIQEGDGLPDKICPRCLAALNTAYNLKVLCEKSDKKLRTSSKKLKLSKILTYVQLEESKVENTIDEDVSNYDFDIDTSTQVEIKEETEAQDEGTHQPENSFEEKLRLNLTLSDIFPAQFIKNEEPEMYENNCLSDNDQELDNFEIKQEKLTKPINTQLLKQRLDIETDCYKDSATSVKKSRALDLKLECDDCGGLFRTKCKMRVHWKKVHLPEKLTCDMCKRRFASYPIYNKHKISSTTCAIAAHTRVEGVGKSRRYYCKNCTYTAKRLCEMKYHVNIHTGDRPYVCKLCNKGFSQHAALNSHMEGVHKIYKVEMTCPHCGKIVKGRNNVYVHLKQHNPDKVQCDICKKFLKSKTFLKQHLETHNVHKSYVCDKCPSDFSTKSSLYNHTRAVHEKMHKRFHCDLCEYKTHLKKILKTHRNKHTGSNFPCTVCGSFHVTPEKLAIHERRHYSERNFECLQCSKKFMSRDNLRNHVRSIHECGNNTSFNLGVRAKKEILIDKIKLFMPGLT